MDLSVIIVSYNAVDFLRLTLQSAVVACANIKAEIFVVDNDSSDHSVEMVRSEFPVCQVIANTSNPGFSVANNQAIHQSSGKYILLLNPDTIVAEDTFTRIIAFMDEMPNTGGLGIKMLDGAGHFLPESKRGIPSPWTSFSKMAGLSNLFPTSKLFSEYHKGYFAANENNSIEVLAGAFMCLRRSVLDEVGLLDEDFFMYGEDIDLSFRILKAGYENYYFAQSSIIHFKGESTIKDRKYVNRFYKAMIQFAEKHYSKGYGFFQSLLIYLGVFIAKFLSSFRQLISKGGVPPVVSGGDVIVLFDEYLPAQSTIDLLSKKYTVKKLSEFNSHAEGIVVFVPGKMSYKEMIHFMSEHKGKFKYRFLNEQHRIIVGSDDKFLKGAVLHY